MAQPVWLSSVSKKDTFQTFVLFLDRSDGILSSFKIVVIFNNTSADFVLISADVLLKMITILKELRIAKLRSKIGGTLDNSPFLKLQNHVHFGL